MPSQKAAATAATSRSVQTRGQDADRLAGGEWPRSLQDRISEGWLHGDLLSVAAGRRPADRLKPGRLFSATRLASRLTFLALRNDSTKRGELTAMTVAEVNSRIARIALLSGY